MPLLATQDEIAALLRKARTIAVVGLSDKPERDSHAVAQYLQRKGYTIIPVNPGASTILGERCHPTLDSIGHSVDIVNVFRKSECVPEIVEAAIRTGAGAVWTQLGVVHDEAARRASDAGLAVVMNRCIAVERRRIR